MQVLTQVKEELKISAGLGLKLEDIAASVVALKGGFLDQAGLKMEA